MSASHSPLRWRTLAIIIMVAGAAAFAASLLLWEGNVICLSGSTLITLTGLGVNIAARSKGWETLQPRPAAPAQTPIHRPLQRGIVGGKAPPGVRAAQRAAAAAQRQARRQGGTLPASAARPPVPPIDETGPGAARAIPNRAPAKPAVPQRPARQESNSHFLGSRPADRALPESEGWQPMPKTGGGLFAQRTAAILRGQGAQVVVEQGHADRLILRIWAASGIEHVALVLETSSRVDVPEVRAIHALVKRTNSGGRGYLISAAGFTERAYQWAAVRPRLRLVAGDELDELGV